MTTKNIHYFDIHYCILKKKSNKKIYIFKEKENFCFCYFLCYFVIFIKHIIFFIYLYQTKKNFKKSIASKKSNYLKFSFLFCFLLISYFAFCTVELQISLLLMLREIIMIILTVFPLSIFFYLHDHTRR